MLINSWCYTGAFDIHEYSIGEVLKGEYNLLNVSAVINNIYAAFFIEIYIYTH